MITKKENLAERCPDCHRREFEISYDTGIPVEMKCLNVRCGMGFALVSAHPAISSAGRNGLQDWEVEFVRKDAYDEEGFKFMIRGIDVGKS